MFKNVHPATWLLATLITLSGLDFACTYVIIEIGGGREINPIMNSVMQSAGTTWALLWYKLGLFGIVVSLYVFNDEFRRKWQSPFMLGVSSIANLCYLSIVIYSYHIIWANDISW